MGLLSPVNGLTCLNPQTTWLWCCNSTSKWLQKRRRYITETLMRQLTHNMSHKYTYSCVAHCSLLFIYLTCSASFFFDNDWPSCDLSRRQLRHVRSMDDFISERVYLLQVTALRWTDSNVCQSFNMVKSLASLLVDVGCGGGGGWGWGGVGGCTYETFWNAPLIPQIVIPGGLCISLQNSYSCDHWFYFFKNQISLRTVILIWQRKNTDIHLYVLIIHQIYEYPR